MGPSGGARGLVRWNPIGMGPGGGPCGVVGSAAGGPVGK